MLVYVTSTHKGFVYSGNDNIYIHLHIRIIVNTMYIQIIMQCTSSPPHFLTHPTSSSTTPPHPSHHLTHPTPHPPHLLTCPTSSPTPPPHHTITSSLTPPPHPPHLLTHSPLTTPPPPHPHHPHPYHLLTHPTLTHPASSPTPPSPTPHPPHLLTHPTSSPTPPPHPPHLLTHPTLTHPTSSPTPPLTHTTPSPTRSTTQLVQTMRERHVLHCLGTQPVPMEGLKGTYQPPSGNMLAVMDWRPPQPRSFSDLLRQRRSLIRSSRVIPSMRHTTLEALGSLPQPQETAQTLVIRSGDEEASRRKSYRQSISNLWKRLSRSKTQGEDGRGPGVGVARWWWVWLGLCRTPHQRLVA